MLSETKLGFVPAMTNFAILYIVAKWQICNCIPALRIEKNNTSYKINKYKHIFKLWYIFLLLSINVFIIISTTVTYVCNAF